MKTRTIKIFLCVLVLFCTIFSGCKYNKIQKQNGEYKTVVDCIGREVDIPVNTEKIAGVDAFSSEVMVMIGAGDKLTSCPYGVKSDVLLEKIYPNLENVAVIQSGGTINAEALLDLNPDVILIKNGLYIIPKEINKIKKLGIPYLVIKYGTMQEQIEALRLVGEVAGSTAKEKADEIAKYYEDTINLVENKKQSIPENERISVYHSINGVTRTDGKTSLGADWINAVGCKNVSVGENLLVEGDIFTASKEQIFVWNPDAVICNESNTADFFKTSKMFSGLRATIDDQVYNIPVGATRWGQQGSLETFFGMLWLGKTIYPKYYEDVNLKQEVFDFYKNILEVELDDSMYGKMLDGKGIRVKSKNL